MPVFAMCMLISERMINTYDIHNVTSSGNYVRNSVFLYEVIQDFY